MRPSVSLLSALTRRSSFVGAVVAVAEQYGEAAVAGGVLAAFTISGNSGLARSGTTSPMFPVRPVARAAALRLGT